MPPIANYTGIYISVPQKFKIIPSYYSFFSRRTIPSYKLYYSNYWFEGYNILQKDVDSMKRTSTTNLYNQTTTTGWVVWLAKQIISERNKALALQRAKKLELARIAFLKSHQIIQLLPFIPTNLISVGNHYYQYYDYLKKNIYYIISQILLKRNSASRFQKAVIRFDFTLSPLDFLIKYYNYTLPITTLVREKMVDLTLVASLVKTNTAKFIDVPRVTSIINFAEIINYQSQIEINKLSEWALLSKNQRGKTSAFYNSFLNSEKKRLSDSRRENLALLNATKEKRRLSIANSHIQAKLLNQNTKTAIVQINITALGMLK